MYERYARTAVEEAMGDTPVVLIVGGRQVGKSTLVSTLDGAPQPESVITLDDPTLRAAAVADPGAFLRGFDGPVAIDEIQRAPELFLVIKMLVDEARLRGERPSGRFLLTGSVAIWDTARMPDSLAGRIEHVRLWPLSQGEIEGHREDLIDRLFLNDPPRLQNQPVGREAVAERVVRGGFPEVQRRTLPRAATWIRDYLALLLDRDIRELGQVERMTPEPAAPPTSAPSGPDVEGPPSDPFNVLPRPGDMDSPPAPSRDGTWGVDPGGRHRPVRRGNDGR